MVQKAVPPTGRRIHPVQNAKVSQDLGLNSSTATSHLSNYREISSSPLRASVSMKLAVAVLPWLTGGSGR